MKKLFEISVDITNINDSFSLFPSFINSATLLYAAACDGLCKGGIGMPPQEYWNDHLITAFFLSRHGLELAVKALIRIKTDKDATGHDIKKLWEDNIAEHDTKISEKMNKAFDVLKKYHVLKDAQLFRYHIDKSGVRLDQLPPIQNEDFDAISSVVWAIRNEILETIHLKKGFPLPY